MGHWEEYQEWKGKTAERRLWDRYPPKRGATAHLEGRAYRLLDISGGGMAIYDYSGESVGEEMVVSLHCPEEGYYIDALRCRKVSDQRIQSESPYGRAVLNRIGLQILERDPDLEHKLAPFMDTP